MNTHFDNINVLDYRKEIMDTFVNSVYVYDHKLLLTHNDQDGRETLTLRELEAALSSDLTSMCPTERNHTGRCGFSIILGNGLTIYRNGRTINRLSFALL